jgi:hypothetical protein
MDLVAVDPSSSADDPCFYGASGSSAAFASGSVSGPLSQRSTIGYGPDRSISALDTDGSYVRLQIEAKTKVDLLQAPAVLCVFSVHDGVVVDALLARLGLSPASTMSSG